MDLTTGYNHCAVLGQINSGPWHRPASEGKAESAAFGLAIPEPSRNGNVYKTYVRCECYGRAVPDALALGQGDTVLIEGKLSWQKSEGSGKAALGVTCWRILKLGSDNPVTG